MYDDHGSRRLKEFHRSGSKKENLGLSKAWHKRKDSELKVKANEEN